MCVYDVTAGSDHWLSYWSHGTGSVTRAPCSCSITTANPARL